MTDRQIHKLIQTQNQTENQALFEKIMAKIADTSEGRANEDNGATGRLHEPKI